MRNPGIQKLIFLLITTSLVVSCVSKKKFVAMENSKIRAEKRVRELTKENKDKDSRIKGLFDEHNQMKNELLASNATKDAFIDSLSRHITALNSNVSETNANLEEKLFAFQYEKRRYNDQLKQLEKANESLKSKISSLEGEIQATKDQLSNVSFDLQKEKDEAIRLRNNLEVMKNEKAAVQKKIDTKDQEIAKLKKTIAANKEDIERLSNNVKLLKKELRK